MSQRTRTLQGALLLAFLTSLWGSTFVVVKDAVDPASPTAWPVGHFMTARFSLAALCFLPFVLKPYPRSSAPLSPHATPARTLPQLWRAGLELGLLLFVGYGTQIIGQKYTSVARSAFITSTYVVGVPLLASLLGHTIRPLLWLCSIAALAGVALLSFDASPPNVGDLWTVATAVAYSLYIYRLEAHSRSFPATALTGISLLAVAACSLPYALSEPHPASPPPYFALIYLAVICTAVVTWLQTIGQSRVTASQAAIIFTLEPLFALAFAYLFRHESLGPRGWLGATLILSAALLSQLPQRQTTPDPHEADNVTHP